LRIFTAEKREAAAREEYLKAQEQLEKQSSFNGIDSTLDPTAQAVNVSNSNSGV